MALTKFGETLVDVKEIIGLQFSNAAGFDTLTIYLRGGSEIKISRGERSPEKDLPSQVYNYLIKNFATEAVL